MYTIRIKLTDFFGTENEDKVFTTLQELQSKFPIKFVVHLWYPKGTDMKISKQLIEKCEGFTSPLKTIIKVGDEVKKNDTPWFDIVHVLDDNLTNPMRFKYRFTNEDRSSEILNGLQYFKELVTFITTPKPPKHSAPQRKQKRNDYEDSNSR